MVGLRSAALLLGMAWLAHGWDARGGPPQVGAVIDLSAPAWTTVVNGRSTVLVVYYTPWCPQCQSLEPKLTHAARQRRPDAIRVTCEDRWLSSRAFPTE